MFEGSSLCLEEWILTLKHQDQPDELAWQITVSWLHTLELEICHYSWQSNAVGKQLTGEERAVVLMSLRHWFFPSILIK